MKNSNKKSNGTNVGFEETLWSAADKMRNSINASDYKDVVLGLIFLKYISDSFEERYHQIKKDPEYYEGMEEEKDAYSMENIFYVPKEARWNYLMKNAVKTEIAKLVDTAMIEIEKANRSLKGVLPKIYSIAPYNIVRLGEVINLVRTIGLGDKESRSKDLLGSVYEYFLGLIA